MTKKPEFEASKRAVVDALMFLRAKGGDKCAPYLHKVAKIIGSNKPK